MRFFQTRMIWQFPLVLVIMALAAWANVFLKVTTQNDWFLAIAFGTPLLVAITLREKNALVVSLVMFGAFVIFSALAPLLHEHGQALSEYMAYSVMPIPGAVVLIGLPGLAVMRLIKRFRSRLSERNAGNSNDS